MSNMTVPAQMVEHLRDGLHSGIGDAADDLAEVVSQSGREMHPEWYREPLARFDDVRGLLDLIGWRETDPPVEVQVDLARHHRALTDALAIALGTTEDDLTETQKGDVHGQAATRTSATKRVLALRKLIFSIESRVKPGAVDEA
jgi:hypothetical protein